MRASTLAVLTLPPLLWASNAIVGRMAAGAIPPFTLNFLRWALALAILFPFVFRRLREDWPLVRKHVGLLAVINIALITASGPIFTLLAGRAFFGAGISRPAALGAVLSMAGVAWVLLRGDPGNLTQIAFVSGDLFMLLAIALWSIYTWLLRERPPAMATNTVLVMQMILGLILAAPMVLAELAWGGYAPIVWNAHAIGFICYVAIVPALLGYLCWQLAVARTGSQLPMFFLNLTPVFAALMSVAVLGEFPHVYHLVGLALIVSGIFMANRPPASPKLR